MNVENKRINFRKLSVVKVIISMILFIMIWWGVCIIPIITPYDGMFKRVSLTALLILLTKYFNKDLKIKLSAMYSKFDIKNLIYSVAGIFICIFFGSCLISQRICSIDPSQRDLTNCIGLFFLAFFEEMLFRGWGYTAFWSAFDNKNTDSAKTLKLFNKFSITVSELKAIVFTNLFFAVIHLQTYIMFYRYNFLQTFESCVGVFLVGTLFTLIYRKTKSIWNIMAVHFFWDYILGIIVR